MFTTESYTIFSSCSTIKSDVQESWIWVEAAPSPRILPTVEPEERGARRRFSQWRKAENSKIRFRILHDYAGPGSVDRNQTRINDILADIKKRKLASLAHALRSMYL